ncbi:hypothetical protein [Glutamicibacter arilaitensis]|uniref:DUF7426 family protein n=1 Tax=Glutamicibacter arilaitensis TaxID=256701 RepID=UPI00384F2496
MATKPTLTELGDFLDPILQVPYRGKKYQIQPVSARTGLRFQKLLAVGVKAAESGKLDPASIELVSDEEELDFYQEILGDTYQELLDDGATATALKAIGSTAFIWTTQGFEMAKGFFDAGGKSPAPNREQRRTATRTRTAAANTTKPQVSANGTTTPKAKPRAKATNGQTSSNTGTASKQTSKTKE